MFSVVEFVAGCFVGFFMSLKFILPSFPGQDVALIQNLAVSKVARGSVSLNSSPFFINLM
jgi:hypothetical protein